MGMEGKCLARLLAGCIGRLRLRQNTWRSGLNLEFFMFQLCIMLPWRMDPMLLLKICKVRDSMLDRLSPK